MEHSKSARCCYELIMIGQCSFSQMDPTDVRTKQIGRHVFVDSICNSTSLYAMTLSLRYLSRICYDLDQFVIALRLLNMAYAYCTMYELTITPTFVKEKYSKKRKKIKKKLNKLVCSYCGRKGKLKCCTACMNAVYCTKLCQKRDWRAGHRNKCDGEWLEEYKKLKVRLVFC